MTALFLNGCTSAGKSTLARALQERLADPHLRLGMDDAFAMLPPALHGSAEGFRFVPDAQGLVQLRLGPFGRRVLHAHIETAAAVVRAGLDLILDEVVLDADLRDRWEGALRDLPVFRVGVRCGLEELERRERVRGDRVIGQARGQFGHVHGNFGYDLEVDTTASPPAVTADRVAEAYRGWRRAA